MKIDCFKNEFFFLSNFYPIELIIDGKSYATSEHYFQACKATLEDDHEKIRNAKTPAETKKLARRIKSFNPNWDNMRMSVMKKVLRVKFSIPEMRDALLLTGNLYLEEGNWWGDTFWGTCAGQGQNNLGILLMEIRKEIANVII